ncbi:GGDEF domain-containing protein [Gottschalkiaceae bacterium SANA]|nr:GGDEF domain-containing protein [Gottschalkiaceae bacterium SANA]
MALFLTFDINFFSALMLVILYVTMRLRRDTTGTSNRLFFRLLWVTVFLLLLEVLSWAFDGVPDQNKLNYFFNFAFAWLTSSATCLLASYIDYHIFGSYQRLKRRWFYLHPFIITGLLLLINKFVPLIFTISPDNIYSREPGMFLLPILNVSVFLYVCLLAYRQRKQVQKEVLYIILLYVSFPAMAAFLQVALFGVFILWPTMAMMVVLTYIFLETVSTSKDYLTGLLSRQRIDSYLEYMLEQQRSFIFVMLDLDDFKTINDRYGHLSGDLALQAFSNSLLKQFFDEKLVGRYAGDEFVLVLEKVDVEGLKAKLQSVEKEMKTQYEAGNLEFPIHFSYGFYEREAKDHISYENMISLADERMYSNKRSHKGEI